MPTTIERKQLMMSEPMLLYTYQEHMHSSNPAWVPSGKRIVVIDGLAFVAMDLESFGNTQVTFKGPSFPSELSSSWEGLVFQSQSGVGGIWTASSFGDGLRLLASGSFPRWSPKGDVIAFVGKVAERTELLVMRPAGVPFWSVARDCDSFSTIGWSPSGDQLVFADSRSYITIARNDGSDIKTLVPDSMPGGWWCWGRNPEWSPRGDLIAFGQHSAEHHVFVVDLDGSLVQKFQGFDRAMWSPDGDRLICTNANELHLVDVKTGAFQFLAKERLPAWSPSGKQIVFINDRSVYLIEV